MADYTLEHKKSFTLTAYGFSIQSNFQDIPALQKEKAEFWGRLKADGRFNKLKDAAKDDREWSVNEVYQGKPWNYFAVEAGKSVADATRVIEFPESDYIVVAGNGDKETLFDQLTYRAFSEVLAKVTDYAYIGGPNATYRNDNGDGTFYGEFWVPVVKK
ncbi:GyrI-like domain-containing protein [Paenibacillus dokdonensis]|uniref:GyrI-like domain-containing protein n=1 Tax=Paenibacillus dokdonensis TaxID=2567944 RepID=A0ABU6GMR7_9BACL|nr:GyrI-like domain-containing protein [Paenibacillus dokdonensis]MEC0240674.1 GyrI-like domain-containing protein [Paenibacillus dokdonensis]